MVIGHAQEVLKGSDTLFGGGPVREAPEFSSGVKNLLRFHDSLDFSGGAIGGSWEEALIML